ncbi:TauD/TfdA family dioxygenase [Qipengyuania sp. DGS5-3]|uniref:TauD/TfdA family dioxygenase n=1 Tax=Qipengyuania sp. DGS5-3 TaxID=3349632 RepID=UPI0036D3630F
MAQFRAFRAQAFHYMMRSHDSVPKEPIDHPAAWDAQAMREAPECWQYALSDADIAELEAALEASAALPIEEISRSSFPLTGLSERIKDWKAILHDGRGFVLVTGLPVERWGEVQSSRAYWALGHHLGVPGAQNPQGELLGHVRDYGEESADPNVRRYRTAGDIAFHCDAADVVGLLCLHPAKKGGESRIASSISIFNRLQRDEPELSARLFEPVLLDRRGEHSAEESPVFPIQPACYSGGVLRTFWHSEYFRSAYQHDGIPPIDDAGKTLLDRYEALAMDSEFHLDMELKAGDMQFISNHFTVHSRTAYEDWAEGGKARHLLRLWLSLEEAQ